MKPSYLVRCVSLLILASAALTAQVARQETVVALKNWATPLYWQPNQTEREAASQAIPQTGGPRLVFSANQVSNNALTFIAITPCRLIDTRGGPFNGISPFSGPSIGALTTVTFPVQSATEASTDTAPAPCGTIPSIAQAYSLNLTVVPVAGGAVDYISMWPFGYPQPFVATLNDPQGAIVANAAIVPAGTVSGGISVYNQGPATANVIIDMNGFFAAPSDLNFNTAIGAGTLASNTTGVYNTASGSGALQNNTTGSYNTASGGGALGSNTTGNNDTALGQSTLLSNTSGTDNTASGYYALRNNTTGGNNTADGAGALESNTTGGGNTASGVSALASNTTGSNNTASGWLALAFNTTGGANTALGQSALESNSSGTGNTATGASALAFNTIGSDNTAGGYAALENNTTGTDNTANGEAALLNNTTGSFNTASGQASLAANTTGGANTASGYEALAANTTGDANTANGFEAMASNTAGNDNMASGSGALQANTTGNFNMASGYHALQNNTTGFENMANGAYALSANTTGGGNTASGFGALQANTTGSYNIALGQSAALNVATGSNNIHIGNAGASSDSGVIRIGTVGPQTSTFIAGISGGTPGTPNLLVCVDGNGQLGTSGCGSTPSSRRFKEQITDMGDSSSKLFQLRPVTFLYKPQYDDGSHTLQYGLIAEEVAKVYPDMVGYDKDGQPSSVKYQAFAPMLLNEVQKQNALLLKQNAQFQSEVQIREEQNRQQMGQIHSLEDRLAALETLLSGQIATVSRPVSSQ